MTILLSVACGYSPTNKKDAGESVGAQAGALADGSPVVEIPPVPDAMPPLPDAALAPDALQPDTSQVIGGSGGTAGSTGSGGMATGGVSGSTGAGGAIINQDAGPKPDAPLTDAPVTCPAPVAPANGQVDPKSLNVGGRAIYTCSKGYGRPSPETRTCQADGTWSGTNPACAPVDCGKLEDPKNGKVKAQTTTYQSEAVYSCDPNFGLRGDGKRTCQDSGTWSGSEPTCLCEQTMCGESCVNLKTDNANCGDCSKICSTVAPSTAQCVPTGCLVTLVRPQYAGDFILDGNTIYWTDFQNGRVNRVSVQGGEPTMVADSLQSPGSLTVNASKLYWASTVGQAAILTMPLSGGQPATLVSGINAPNGFAVNATDLYYVVGLGIGRIPLAGGEASIFVPISGSQVRSLILDSTNLYWVADNGSSVKIMKQPLAGGGDPILLVSTNQIKAMVVDATHAYWTTPETSTSKGSVSKIPLAGGAPTVLASGLDGPEEIVVDGTYVYWTGDFGGQVLKLSVAGGTPSMLISSRWLASSLAIDSTSIYWYENRNDTGARTTAFTKLTPR